MLNGSSNGFRAGLVVASALCLEPEPVSEEVACFQALAIRIRQGKIMEVLTSLMSCKEFPIRDGKRAAAVFALCDAVLGCLNASQKGDPISSAMNALFAASPRDLQRLSGRFGDDFFLGLQGPSVKELEKRHDLPRRL